MFGLRFARKMPSPLHTGDTRWNGASTDACAPRTRDAEDTDSISPSVELADRHSNDLDVVLMWGQRSGQLWVLVTHRCSGRTARINATATNALDVFHHPFAYAGEGL
ncbi:MAG: hypothetical protein QOD48_1273 [Gaiellaceae bacterium]|nr:hypothetical protein [Gaiellaceae bacterium]